ncbi:G1/S-specific cyclin-D2, partial [Pseudolycoriella hygida]
DETLAKDPRIIPNLLKLEQTMNPPCDYFKTIQTEIKPLMRRIVTNWMCEICDEQKCEYQVLPLAINYMDRFLCLKPITTSQFQLLAAVCLLLASKVRQSHYLTSDLLIYYADNCVTKKDLLNWEILVLTTLEWLLTAPTSYDFIQHIAERVPWGRENINIIRHALTLNSVCQT